MILSPEERAEWEQMLAEAWANSSSVAIVAADLDRMLIDAARAGRMWADIIREDALDAGLQKMAKAYKRQQTKTVKGPIATTVGVVGASGKYEQLELANCSPDQLRAKLTERERHLKAASRNAAALRKFIAICDKHPKARTLGAALRAEGVTIAEVLAA